MFVLLHGAIKNVGDFLIFERAKALLREYATTDDFVEIPRWESLESYLEQVNEADAVILCGGPAYASNFYPGIYPFVDDLDRIKPPIVPLGLGWSGKSGNAFRFTRQSLAAIERIHDRIPYSSVRDVVTKEILGDQGITNVAMTGCPAWYHLPSIDLPFEPPRQIRKIAISTPARPANFPRTKAIVDWALRRYPDAECYLVFHRGIWYDKNTPPKDGVLNPLLAAYGWLKGVNIVNAAYSTDHIAFYKSIDLHVGFRVHGHINALSYRRPSILVHEDGRGMGQSATLKTQDIEADPKDLAGQLNAICDEFERTDFASFKATFQTMREKHSVMKQFVESI